MHSKAAGLGSPASLFSRAPACLSMRTHTVSPRASAPTPMSGPHRPASSLVCRGATLAMPTIAPAAAAASSPTFFEDLLSDSRTPLLVDFYATWCGPCQLMSGVLKDLEPSLHDMRIVKIDIDKHPQLATKYRVQGLPTLLLFRQGQPVDRVEGMMDRKSLGKRLRFYTLGLENKFGRR